VKLKTNPFFPSLLYRDAIWRLSKFSIVIFVATGFLIYWRFLTQVAEWPESHRFLEVLGTTLLTYILVGSLALVLLFAYLGRRILSPIGEFWSALTRFDPRKPSRKEQGLVDDEELYEEEIGEWTEINKALAKIEFKVRKAYAQHENEQVKIRTIMNSVTDAIIAVDCDLHVLFLNKNISRIFGTKIRTGKSSYLTDLIRTPDVLDLFRKVLASGQEQGVDMELEVGPMATRKHFSLAVAPLKKEPTEVVYGAVGVIHDITELKRGEQMRIEFVANASHELRTPLTLVSGYLQTIQEDMERGQQQQVKEFLAVAAKNVRRLQNLVADLLDLSAIESGAPMQRTYLESLIITEEVLARFERPGVNVRERVSIIVEKERVYADPLRLNQVLINLIDNALKYTTEKDLIEVLWQSQKGGTLLTIRDHGGGISKEHLPRIFERFYRVDEGRSSAQGGTGLGLSIVKHIMVRHGGEVRVTSKEGVGTSFLCFFPDQKI
jgi:two-component system phosphate regulon sensor histidine kinase PhoR